MEQFFDRPEFQSAVIPFGASLMIYAGLRKFTGSDWNGGKLSSVTADLNIMGVGKPVTLKVISINCGEHPFNKKQVCGFDAQGSIKRTDYGVNYGAPAIGEVLDLQIEEEAFRECTRSGFRAMATSRQESV